MSYATARLKDLCEDGGQYGFNTPAVDYVSQGVRMLRTSDLDVNGRVRDDIEPVFVDAVTDKKFLVRAGDLLLTRSGSIGRSFLVPQLSEPTTFAGFLVRYRPAPTTDPRFLAYVAESTPFQQAVQADAVSSTIQNFNAERYASVRVPHPPLEEQRRIADFLDAETLAGDALATARRYQRGLLEERELAVIRDALTGVGVQGSRQASGVRWMPDLPSAWSVAPVYAHFDVRLGKMLNPERAGGANLQPYLRNANIHWDSIQTDDLAEMSFDPSERARFSVSVGDLLICEGGAGVAEAAVWSDSSREIYFQKSLHRCRPTSALPVDWMLYWLRLAKHTGVFAAEGNLATIPHLTGEQLRSHRIPVAPDALKRVSALRTSIDALQLTGVALGASDSLMKERRQAVITAAVTGHLDVTTARESTS